MLSAQITLHNFKRPNAFTRRIREKCEALERFHPHILRCRVQLEQPDARIVPGRPYHVTLLVSVPGRELVAENSHHVDVHLAVRDAFAAMRRQLKDAASVARREVKEHSQPRLEATQ